MKVKDIVSLRLIILVESDYSVAILQSIHREKIVTGKWKSDSFLDKCILYS